MRLRILAEATSFEACCLTHKCRAAIETLFAPHPQAPSPHEFGSRLMQLQSVVVRILEERGLSGLFFYLLRALNFSCCRKHDRYDSHRPLVFLCLNAVAVRHRYLRRIESVGSQPSKLLQSGGLRAE